MTEPQNGKSEKFETKNNHTAFFAALIGTGVSYSLINGYGLLHAFGMAVSYAIIGVILIAAYKVTKEES